MFRHANWHNIMLIAYLVKLWRQMAPMAIKNQKAVFSSHATICSCDEDILKTEKTNLISYPSIFTEFNPPVMWQSIISIPGLYMRLSFEYNARRQSPPHSINASNCNRAGKPAVSALVTILAVAIRPITKPVSSKL